MVPENNAMKSRRIGTNIPNAVKTICLEGVMFADAAGAGSEDLRFFISRFVISAEFITLILIEARSQHSHNVSIFLNLLRS
jgi:hypothetical protein